MPPIFQTSTYIQKKPGDHLGYEYARTQNPTRDVLQANLAALEGAKHAVCFSSGMAAVDAIIKLLQPGDEIICTNDLYGGTYRTFRRIFEKYGLKFHFIDLKVAANIEAHFNANTKMIWVETPTNPMLNIIDIETVAGLAHAHSADIKVVVDNTFATPYLQQPMSLGADIVIHSATKYIGGHSDVIHGTAICNDDKIAEDLAFIQNGTGAVPGPQDCFLVIRGIKTLKIRMEQHCKNGEAIAKFLKDHSKVDKVHWPGFESHFNHEIAKKQMRNFGVSNTKYFLLAESLGGVESLIGHPATMTHASIPKEEREKTGVTDSLIRLSVGIEDIDDLIADLDKALSLV
ncbi:UNVERIFIED_CONTAM: hypothetical protein GTU68_032759 [Idotea baltica]|nr:hypothetical protein [Idotea baltica]